LSQPVIELLGVEKTYRDFWGRPRVRALAPLDLAMAPGEVLALLGPNGAGKSTTIKLVLGLLRPTKGRVSVFGDSPRRPAARARIGYLPEETRLHKFLDPRETLDLFGRLHGLPRAERRRRIDQLIDMVGLRGNEARPVGEFSKGMARRIGLAVALTGDPDLLILDEPTSGLDPLGTRDIKTLIGELRDRGRSVLLSSHLLDDVEDVADRIAILFGGRLRRLGRTAELLTQGDRLRLELDRPDGVAPDAFAAQVAALLPDGGAVEASVPADRLETLFRRVLADAAHGPEGTSGAQAGGPIAGFLLDGAGPNRGSPAEAAPAAPSSEAQAPAQPTPTRPPAEPAPPLPEVRPLTPTPSAVDQADVPTPPGPSPAPQDTPAGAAHGATDATASPPAPVDPAEAVERAPEPASPRPAERARPPAPTGRPALDRLLGVSPRAAPPADEVDAADASSPPGDERPRPAADDGPAAATLTRLLQGPGADPAATPAPAAGEVGGPGEAAAEAPGAADAKPAGRTTALTARGRSVLDRLTGDEASGPR
jgi:ABC-2 type transport system ATP-binding protein